MGVLDISRRFGEERMSGSPSMGKADGQASGAGVLHSFIVLYSSWMTLLTNIVFFVVYYLIFYAVIFYSNFGYFLLTIPFYLLALLVLASSSLATVAVSYLRLSRRKRTLTGMAQSPIGVALGAFVASCSCSLPLIAPALYFIGLNALEVSGIISFFASYQEAIIQAVVVLDVLSIYYYLRLIARSGITRTPSLHVSARSSIAGFAPRNVDVFLSGREGQHDVA
jgi:hypothetical protein